MAEVAVIIETFTETITASPAEEPVAVEVALFAEANEVDAAAPLVDETASSPSGYNYAVPAVAY